jgi:hypothetical protein
MEEESKDVREESKPDPARARYNHVNPSTLSNTPNGSIVEPLSGLEALKTKNNNSKEGLESGASSAMHLSPPQSPVPHERVGSGRARPRRSSATVKRESIKQEIATQQQATTPREEEREKEKEKLDPEPAEQQSSWEKKLAEANVRTRNRKASHIVKRDLNVCYF